MGVEQAAKAFVVAVQGLAMRSRSRAALSRAPKV
jgi:hypothetical protein